MTEPKPSYCLKFFDDPYSAPFNTEWDDMPKQLFDSEAEADAAAKEFAKQFSEHGFDKQLYCWWVRDVKGDKFRVTNFTVEPVSV